MKERIAELEKQLEYFHSRGQRIMDLTAQRILTTLEDPNADITPAFLNVARQFIKDQGLVDLQPGTSDTQKLALVLPFPAERGGNFDTLESNAR